MIAGEGSFGVGSQAAHGPGGAAHRIPSQDALTPAAALYVVAAYRQAKEVCGRVVALSCLKIGSRSFSLGVRAAFMRSFAVAGGC
jgi:hypothetical protein